MADINTIILPNGTSYEIADSTARQDITDLKKKVTGSMYYMGITTTQLVDGSTTNPIDIDGTMINASAGAVALFGEEEFIFNGTKWQRFGVAGSFGALAFKSSASGKFTPGGSVSQPTFTGDNQNVSAGFTPEGTVDIDSFTPTGTVSKPETTVVLNTTTVNSITDVGSLPSCTLPAFTATVSSGTLTLGWTAGSFSAGDLPTKGSNQTVAISVKSASTTQPTFTGDAVSATASFTGTPGTASGTFKATGTVSKPTFTGTEGTVTVS